MKRLRPAFYLVMEDEKHLPLIDQTDARLLRYIDELGSISEAASKVGISFRAAWSRVKELEHRFRKKLVERKSGGLGGGGASLTSEGKEVLKDFRRVRKYVFDALEDFDFWQHAGYKLSARNKLRARIKKIEKSGIISKITLDSIRATKITSIISTEAVEELDLKEGDEVNAIIKATEVILAKD